MDKEKPVLLVWEPRFRGTLYKLERWHCIVVWATLMESHVVNCKSTTDICNLETLLEKGKKLTTCHLPTNAQG